MSVTQAPLTRAQRRRPRSRATFGSVLGELLLTVGVIALLFVAWQMWIGDLIMGHELNQKGAALSESWDSAPVIDAPERESTDDGQEVWKAPVVPAPTGTEVYANLIVPRFGADFRVNIAGGTTREETLDRGNIGTYRDTKMPGQAGNYAIAGHRTSWGGPFNPVNTLRLNDAIVVETEAGWYTYRFRTLEYVTPDQSDVLQPVPQMPGVSTGESYITLTGCSPIHSLDERIIAYGVFDSFQPRAEGPPPSITEGAS